MATVVDSLLVTLGLDTQDLEKGLRSVIGRLSGDMKAVTSEMASSTTAAAAQTSEQLSTVAKSADTSTESLKRLEQGASRLSPVMGTVSGKIKELVRAMAAPVMAAFAGASAGALTTSYVSQAQGLKQLSDSLGMSMEDLQGWQYAAESAGAEAEEVGNFFRDMNDYIVDATTFDSGPLKDISKELGLSLKDAQGNVRDTMDVVLDLSDAFQKVGPQKAVAFGMQMGIDPGMIQLLQKGRAEIEGLIKAQQELGGYTKEDAEIVAKAQFAFMSFGRAIQAAALPVARVLVPMMTKATEKFSEAVAFLRKHEPFMKAVFAGIAAVITARLIPASVKLAAVWLANPLTWIIGGIAAAIVAIGLAIDDLIAYMNGGKSVFADFWSILGTGPEIAEMLGRAWGKLKSIGSSLWDGLVAGVNWFSENFGSVFSGLERIATGVLQTIKGLFESDFNTIAEGIGNIFNGIADVILGIFGGIVKSVADAFGELVSSVGQWFTDMLASIPGLGWALEKMGVVDSEEQKTKTLAPTTADSGKLASQASHAAVRQEVNATSEVRTGDIIINTAATNAQGIAREFGDEVSRYPWKNMPFSSQTGVNQK